MASQLTSQQQTALKAAILAAGGAIAAAFQAGASSQVADLCNVDAAGPVQVWRTEAPVQAIYDAITWSSYTPQWVPKDIDSAQLAALYTNSLLLIQTKQMNLQNMLQGRATVDASKANVRAGLRDAVVQIPAGNVAANVVGMVAPGGVNGATVLAACLRNATFAEAALKGNNATTGATTAALLGFEGRITTADIDQLTTLP